MANLLQVNYNGETIISNEEYCSGEYASNSIDINFRDTQISNSENITSVNIGEMATLETQGKKCDKYISLENPHGGGGIIVLDTIDKYFISNIEVSLISLFPEEPTSYELIDTYTTSQTWEAPEDGYFYIEVFGASGNGGAGYKAAYSYSGGGGGGGAVATSYIILNANDNIILTCGAVGNNTSASIMNTTSELYYDMVTTSGNNGGDGKASGAGAGGAGGTASGGNGKNLNGNAGSAGAKSSTLFGVASGGAGGVAVSTSYSTGNAGGAGADAQSGSSTFSAESGSSGFIKIYRGNTNLS